jgi:hypothetical protein
MVSQYVVSKTWCTRHGRRRSTTKLAGFQQSAIGRRSWSRKRLLIRDPDRRHIHHRKSDWTVHAIQVEQKHRWYASRRIIIGGSEEEEQQQDVGCPPSPPYALYQQHLARPTFALPSVVRNLRSIFVIDWSMSSNDHPSIPKSSFEMARSSSKKESKGGEWRFSTRRQLQWASCNDGAVAVC